MTDKTTAGVITVVVGGLILLIGWYPGRVAKRRSHPNARAIEMMGRASVLLWISALALSWEIVPVLVMPEFKDVDWKSAIGLFSWILLPLGGCVWLGALIWANIQVENHAIAHQASKQCPFCAEPIAVAAIKCKHCGSLLSEVPVASVAAPLTPATPLRNEPVPAIATPLPMAAVADARVVTDAKDDSDSHPAAKASTLDSADEFDDEPPARWRRSRSLWLLLIVAAGAVFAVGVASKGRAARRPSVSSLSAETTTGVAANALAPCELAALGCEKFRANAADANSAQGMIRAARLAGRHIEAICLANTQISGDDRMSAGTAYLEMSYAWEGLGCAASARQASEAALAVLPNVSENEKSWTSACARCRMLGGNCTRCELPAEDADVPIGPVASLKRGNFVLAGWEDVYPGRTLPKGLRSTCKPQEDGGFVCRLRRNESLFSWVEVHLCEVEGPIMVVIAEVPFDPKHPDRYLKIVHGFSEVWGNASEKGTDDSGDFSFALWKRRGHTAFLEGAWSASELVDAKGDAIPKYRMFLGEHYICDSGGCINGEEDLADTNVPVTSPEQGEADKEQPPGAKSPASAAIARVTLSSSRVLSGSPRAISDVAAKVRSTYLPALEHCYRELLEFDERVTGSFSLTFSLDDGMRAVEPRALGLGYGFEACVARAASRWQFLLGEDDAMDALAARTKFELTFDASLANLQ